MLKDARGIRAHLQTPHPYHQTLNPDNLAPSPKKYQQGPNLNRKPYPQGA